MKNKESNIKTIFNPVKRDITMYDEKVADIHIVLKNKYLDSITDINNGFKIHCQDVGISKSKIVAIALLCLNKKLNSINTVDGKVEYIKELLKEYKGE